MTTPARGWAVAVLAVLAVLALVVVVTVTGSWYAFTGSGHPAQRHPAPARGRIDGPHGHLPAVSASLPATSVRVSAALAPHALGYVHGLEIDQKLTPDVTDDEVTAVTVPGRSVYWRYRGRTVASSLDTATGRLYLFDGGSIVRIDVIRARVEWRAPTAHRVPGGEGSVLRVDGHLVVLADESGNGASFDADTGRPLASFTGPGGCAITRPFSQPVLLVGRTVVVETHCGTATGTASTLLSGYDADTGARRWSWRNAQLGFPNAADVPDLAPDLVLAALTAGTLVAWAHLPGGAGQGQVVIDLSTGAQTRRRAPIEVMAVLDARLIGRCPELSGDLCSYDPAAGAFRWHTPVPAGIELCPSLAWSSGVPSATATGGRIYALAEDHPDCVTADNQYLLVIDQRTGTLISALDLPSRAKLDGAGLPDDSRSKTLQHYVGLFLDHDDHLILDITQDGEPAETRLGRAFLLDGQPASAVGR